jgi:hypothetical protein
MVGAPYSPPAASSKRGGAWVNVFVSFSGANKTWVSNFTHEDHFFYGELRQSLFLYTRDPIQGGSLRQALTEKIDDCDAFVAIICADYGRDRDGRVDLKNPCALELATAIRKWDGADARRRGLRIVVTHEDGVEFFRTFRAANPQCKWLQDFVYIGEFKRDGVPVELRSGGVFNDAVERIKEFCRELRSEIATPERVEAPAVVVADADPGRRPYPARVHILKHPYAAALDVAVGDDARALRERLASLNIPAEIWEDKWLVDAAAAPALVPEDRDAVFVQTTSEPFAEMMAAAPQAVQAPIDKRLGELPATGPGGDALPPAGLPRILVWLPAKLREPALDIARPTFNALASRLQETATWPRASLDTPEALGDLIRREFRSARPSIVIMREMINRPENTPYVNRPVRRLTEGMLDNPSVFRFSTSEPEALERLRAGIETRTVALIAFHDLNVNAVDAAELTRQLQPKLREVGDLVRSVRRRCAVQAPVKLVLLTQPAFLEDDLVAAGDFVLDDGEEDCPTIRVETTPEGIRGNPDDIESVKRRLAAWMQTLGGAAATPAAAGF